MKILQIHNFYQQRGGEDQVLFSEANLFRATGHDVVQYTLDNVVIENMSDLILAQKTIWNQQSYREIQGILEAERPDICHFHNTFPLVSPSAYYACQKHHVPVIQTLHNYRLFCPKAVFFQNGQVCEDCLNKLVAWPGIWHACYRDSHIESGMVAVLLAFHHLIGTYSKKVDYFITLTEFAKNKFIEAGLPEEKVLINANFLDVDPERKKGLGEYALFVGRLSREKGIDTMLNAFKRLSAIPLRIVGDGPLLNKLTIEVKQANNKNIQLLGRVSREVVMNLMKNARLLIFPSEWYEGFPVTIAEALACGLPVIASRLGAMAELIQDGQNGLLFEAGNPDDLAEKVATCWDDKDKLRQMGLAARAEFENKYTREHKYQSLMRIYEQAIHNQQNR